MSISNFMNMTLPTVSVTLGPDYATQNNAAFVVLDGHDHTSGKGTLVPTSGLNINANLNFQSKKAYNLYSAQLINQATALTGASNALSISTTTGDLYFTNGSGNSVQITSGGAVISAPGTTVALELTTITSNLLIGPSDTFVTILVDTTSSRTVTLPLASGVAAGRIYIIKDKDGLSNTNAISILVQGADTIDGLTSQTINSNFGSVMVTGNGAAAWNII